jgi:hypothetical protein
LAWPKATRQEDARQWPGVAGDGKPCFLIVLKHGVPTQLLSGEDIHDLNQAVEFK